MNRGTRGLRALGPFLLAALGLMAVIASAAQAEGCFAIDGTPIAANEPSKANGGFGRARSRKLFSNVALLEIGDYALWAYR
jgi:hypothetical protein